MRWIICLAACAMLSLEGCGGGVAKISEQSADPVFLRDQKQAVVLIRFAPPDPTCIALGMQIGVREGDLYRPTQTLRLKELAVTNVMEVMLDPGTYHVLSLTCVRAKSMQTMWEPQGNGLLRRSYATFSVSAGEVINAGDVKAVKTGQVSGLHNAFVSVVVEVSDWPLAEIERFKSQRPTLFAEMKTRLMTVDASAIAPGSTQRCEEMLRLHAMGKVQNMPADCSGTTAQKN